MGGFLEEFRHVDDPALVAPGEVLGELAAE
jgi:hypothetical protein